MGRALRVALVTEFYYPHLGGVTEHVYHFSRELAREGHAPLVITSHMSPKTQDAPFVRRVGRSVTLPSNGSLARITVGTRLGRQVTEILKAGTFWKAEDYHQSYYKKNPIRYNFYRSGCGRDARLKEIWGDAAPKH